MSATLKIVEEMILQEKTFIVHCETKEMRQNFFEYITKFGVCWRSGHDPLSWATQRFDFMVGGKILTQGLKSDYQSQFPELPRFVWSEVLDNSFKIAFDEGEFEKILGV